MPGEDPLPNSQTPPFCYILTGQEKQGSSMRVSFIRVLIPFMRALPLEPRHPQRLHLLISSYWRLEVQYMYFGEHKHSVYSSVFFKIWRIIALKLCVGFGCITIWISHCCCSVTKSCPTLRSHELQHTRLLWPGADDCSNHQDLLQCVDSLHQVVKVLELQLQHQSFQWIFRVNFL